MQGTTDSIYVIAEAGINHDGSEEKARMLVDIAAASGADAVKFQLFVPESLVTETAPTASYQANNLADHEISQRDMLRQLTLPEGAFARLNAYCDSLGIDFLCTPFDAPSLAYLAAHTRMPYLKLASGEVTNGPLLLLAARTGLPVILSTGMSDLQEIGVALSILHHGFSGAVGAPPLVQPSREALEALRGKVIILHCVSQYPAPMGSMNLRAMDSIAERFGLPVGLSDHSLGTTMPIAAAARGAVMVEKHFTYDIHAAGPDHAASLAPQELKAMVQALRDVPAGLGQAEKRCVEEEKNTRTVARRSVVAARPITKGDVFTEDNLICKRPATGPLPPHAFWALLGLPAQHDYAPDAFIRREELPESS